MDSPGLRAIVRSPTGACLRIGGIGPAGAWIGRSDDCDVVVDDPARIVSARHCRVDFGDGRFWVTDQSRNGTTLNGAALHQGARQPVEPGDTLGMGGLTVTFETAAAPADPAAAVAAAPAQAAWDLDDTAAAPGLPRFGNGVASTDQLHALLDELVSRPPDAPAAALAASPPAERQDTGSDRRLTVFMPDRPRIASPAVAPFWYGLGISPPAGGPDDPADLLIELGAALRALAEGLGQRLPAGGAGNPLVAGPEAVRQFLATRHPDGPTLDKLVRDALARLDTVHTDRQRATRDALDVALRSMTPRAVEARFGGMIRGWRRTARRAALLDLLARMEDELVELAETRFLRDVDQPPARAAERSR